LNDDKMRLAVVVVVAMMVVGGRIANADFTFGPAENLGPTINSPSTDQGASITGDGLELYFSSDRPGGGYAGGNIWVAKRPTKNDEWGEPENLGAAVNWGEAGSPAVTGDGLELYFVSSRTGGYGRSDIWVTKRESKDSPWGEPENLGSPPNTDKKLWGLGVSNDGLELYFSSGSGANGYGAGTSGGHDIWVSKRAHKGAPWSEPAKIGPTINGSDDLDWENGQALSSDGLTIIFSSSRLGGFSTMTNWNLDLWMARRETKEAPWGEVFNLGPGINTRYSDMASSLSADGRMLYFWQRHWEGVRPGGQGGIDIWQAPIIPVVDFNADGIVDSEDMLIMVEHWGEDYPLCDIGPMPWGDGVVDVRDMIVLNGYMSPAPITHWKLDETEGMFAVDSAGDNDALVVGDISWRPGGGQLDGALQLNGVDGCAIAGTSLNPAHGPFSVFAWVNVALRGRVIISQQNVSDWLAVNADGKLMTELKSCDGPATPLVSETVITDSKWHRIGLVWDGSHRILYVDGEPAAEDTLAGLHGSQMGLYIGVDKNYTPGTFFAGLIDDIRIYGVALSEEQIEGLAQ